MSSRSPADPPPSFDRPRIRVALLGSTGSIGRQAVEVAGGKIGGLSVRRAELINDFELGQNPALRDTFKFDTFIWEPN